MSYDSGDLLGGSSLPIIREKQGQSWTPHIYGTAVAVVIAVWFLYGKQRYNAWVEKNHKKQLRRMYGIPDDDNAVFNVAYARAAKRREEEEEETAASSQAPPNPVVSDADVSIASSLRGQKAEASTVRSRHPSHSLAQQPTNARVDDSYPYGREFPTASSSRSVGNQLPERRKPSRAIPSSQSTPQLRASRPSSEAHHGLSKLRHSTDGIVDLGDNDDMDLSLEIPGGAPLQASHAGSKRGSKRQSNVDDDGATEHSRRKSGSKRARKTSVKSAQPPLPKAVEEDEDRDQLMDLDPISRGKKRDRAEAGSTFGVEDDSPHAQERKVRRRKRKSGAEEVVIQVRGTKRSHDIESTLDSEDESYRPHVLSRKRGKRASLEYDDSLTDSSTDAGRISKDPACGGRRIGEEWQANGQLFKVGPDGRRLRQALVKKRRSRYSMPVDSEHPDSHAQMVVLVEKWLTDAEYKTAEEQGEIFTPKSVDADMSGIEDEEQPSPVKSGGKQLLWQSTNKFIVPKRPFKDSIATNVGLNVNPFEQPVTSKYDRRVSAGPAVFRVSSADIPLLRHSKSYSKWEKQELEADAIAKLRKKHEEQKKLASPDVKHVSFDLRTSVSAPAVTRSISTPAPTGATSFVAPSASDKASAQFTPAPVFADATKPTAASIVFPSAAPAPAASTAAPNASDQSKTPSFSFLSSTPDASQPIAAAMPTPPAPSVAAGAAAKSTTPISFGQPPGSYTSDGTFSFGDKVKSTMQTAAPASTPFAPTATGTSFASPFGPTTAPSGAQNIFGKPASGAGANSLASAQPLGSTAMNAFGGPTPVCNIFGAKDSAPASATTPGAKPNDSNAAGGTVFSRVGQPSGSTPSPFSFTPTPAATEAKAPAATINTPAPAATAASSAPSVPKFNFGFTSKPTAPAGAAFTPPAPANVTMSEAPKLAAPATGFASTTQPSFNFGATTAQPSTTTGARLGSPFGFGAPANTGATTTATPAQPSVAPQITVTSPSTSSTTSSAPKFSFNLGSASTSSSAPTSLPARPATASGISSSGSTVPKPLFGHAQSGSATTPTDKTVFQFGAPPARGASPFGSTTTTTFGSGPSTSPFGGQGSQTGVTSPFGGQGSQTTSPFGGQGGQTSAFGGTGESTNIFGAKPAGGASTFAFGSNPAAGVFGAKPASTTASAAPGGAPNTTSNVFGSTNNPSGGFAFSTPSTNPQNK